MSFVSCIVHISSKLIFPILCFSLLTSIKYLLTFSCAFPLKSEDNWKLHFWVFMWLRFVALWLHHRVRLIWWCWFFTGATKMWELPGDPLISLLCTQTRSLPCQNSSGKISFPGSILGTNFRVRRSKKMWVFTYFLVVSVDYLSCLLLMPFSLYCSLCF